MFGSAVEHKVLQGQVDGRSDETWAKNKTADLELEARLAPRVAIHKDTANVSRHLEKSADTECCCVGPSPSHDTDYDGGDKTDSEQGAEKGVDAHHWGVSIKCGVDRTIW